MFCLIEDKFCGNNMSWRSVFDLYCNYLFEINFIWIYFYFILIYFFERVVLIFYDCNYMIVRVYGNRFLVISLFL